MWKITKFFRSVHKSSSTTVSLSTCNFLLNWVKTFQMKKNHWDYSLHSMTHFTTRHLLSKRIHDIFQLKYDFLEPFWIHLRFILWIIFFMILLYIINHLPKMLCFISMYWNWSHLVRIQMAESEWEFWIGMKIAYTFWQVIQVCQS